MGFIFTAGNPILNMLEFSNHFSMMCVKNEMQLSSNPGDLDRWRDITSHHNVCSIETVEQKHKSVKSWIKYLHSNFQVLSPHV